MEWKVVILWFYFEMYQAYSKSVTSCEHALLENIGESSELFSSREALQIDDDNNEESNKVQLPCGQPIFIKCDNHKAGQSNHLNDDPNSSRAADLSSEPKDACSGCKSYRQISKQNEKSALEERKRRNRMYQDLLKLTTVLNRIDTLFTEKAKLFIRGLNKMVESKEEKDE